MVAMPVASRLERLKTSLRQASLDIKGHLGFTSVLTPGH